MHVTQGYKNTQGKGEIQDFLQFYYKNSQIIVQTLAVLLLGADDSDDEEVDVKATKSVDVSIDIPRWNEHFGKILSVALGHLEFKALDIS